MRQTRKSVSNILLWALLLTGLKLHGQELFGSIIDQDGEPIPFVHVWYKGTHFGTYANRNGQFRLTSKEADTVVFSVVGYERLELPTWKVGVQQEVVLREVIIELDEVVTTSERMNNSIELGYKKAGKATLTSDIRENYTQKFKISVGKFSKAEGLIEAIHFRVAHTTSLLPLVGQFYFMTAHEDQLLHSKPIYFSIVPAKQSEIKIDLVEYEIPCPKGKELFVFLTFMGFEEGDQLLKGSVGLAYAARKTIVQKTFSRRSPDDPWDRSSGFYKLGPVYDNLNVWLDIAW